ncbi:MAG TPA: sigma-70 family RNA polymerase sigma factor [Polyangiales bacterium]|nr:sigma-70 family RNA polymerase sigma factor [Polyangiales bacterium]
MSGPRTVPPAAHDEQRELELVAAIARGEREAARTLATRMASRVERVSRALLGGSLDARDAALHALTELLRSHANYRGKLRLERWADRVAALSVMRYGHAVSRRDAEQSVVLPSAESGSAARTFEQYIGMLSAPSRQFLLLRHALGFSVAELADVMQCSQQSARERLLTARRELRSLVRRRESHPPTLSTLGGGLGAQRWCALRDREALGEPLLPEEQEEAALLEAKEAEVWAFVAQVRALELYFDTRTPTRAPIDGALIERAVEALEVSSATVKTRAIVDDVAHETRAEREPSSWVGVIAWAASAALAAASAVALYWHQPAPALDANVLLHDPAPPIVAPAAAAPPRPTVESMPSARTATRGARLRHRGRQLAEGSVLGQGETVETLEKPGCLEIEPAFEVCLAPGSALILSTLQSGSRRLTLVRGRVVARGNDANGTLSLVVAEGLTASTQHGALAVERAGDQVRVRALRGPIALRDAGAARELAEGEGAQLQAGTLTVAPAQTALLQRDWDVLATGLHQVAKPKPRAVLPKLEESEADVLAETLRDDE